MALDIFITPKPCETIFSLLTRAHLMSGSLSPLTTLRNLTGHRGYKPLSSLPSNLQHICGCLNLEVKPDQIIKRNTLFPFYKPFLPEARRSFVIEGMLNSGATKSRIGLLKSHCGAADQLAYCAECVKADTYKFGFSYWHREHMLVGVELCHLHGCPLVKIKIEESQFGARRLQLPGELVLSNNLDKTQYERLAFVAEQVAWITNNDIEIFIGSHSYKQLLRERDLMTTSYHVRMKSLQACVSDWLTPLAKISPFAELLAAFTVERNWVASIVAGKEGMHHPLKHIAIWGALKTNFETFIQRSQVEEQLSLPLEIKSRPEITEKLLLTTVKKCRTATASAKFLNCSVQTVLVLMEKFGITIKRKPSKLNREVIEKIIFLSSQGMPPAEIAPKLHLSVSTVNRVKRSHRA